MTSRRIMIKIMISYCHFDCSKTIKVFFQKVFRQKHLKDFQVVKIKNKGINNLLGAPLIAYDHFNY